MTVRLDYETSGGQLSESATFEQLMEHLIKAQEACLSLGHYRKMQDDEVLGIGWLMVGEMLRKMQVQVTQLAGRRIHTGIGFNQ